MQGLYFSLYFTSEEAPLLTLGAFSIYVIINKSRLLITIFKNMKKKITLKKKTKLSPQAKTYKKAMKKATKRGGSSGIGVGM